MFDKQADLTELYAIYEDGVKLIQGSYKKPGLVNFILRDFRFRKDMKKLNEIKLKIDHINKELFNEFVSLYEGEPEANYYMFLAYMVSYFSFVSPRIFDLLSVECFPPAIDAWYKPGQDDSALIDMCEDLSKNGISIKDNAGCLPVFLFNVERILNRDNEIFSMSNSVKASQVMAEMKEPVFPKRIINYAKQRMFSG